jgi:Prenyltransferase and squalene oxidase repeat
MRQACLLLFTILAAPVHAGDAKVKQSIAYVQKLQSESGGFLAQAQKLDRPIFNPIVPTLRATSAAIRALHYLGGDIKDKDACIKFVASCYDAESGGFGDVPKGKLGVFETAVGLMAVVELKMPLEKYGDGATKYLADHAKTFEEIRIAAAGMEAIKQKSPKQKEWLSEVMKDALLDKKPVNARNTASTVVTMMRLGNKSSDPAACLKSLNAGQRKTGGWGKEEDGKVAFDSDLESTYRVMRCFVMLKARPDKVEDLRTFVGKCRNEDGGYGVALGQPSSVSGTYFASIITHWLKEKQ